MVSSLAINKLFAIYFGGTGIALLAHLQNLMGMVTLVSTEGIQRGLTKYLSDETIEIEAKKQFLGAGLIWILSVFVAASLLISRFDTIFLVPFLGERHPVVSYLIFMSSLLGQLLYLTGTTLLLIQKRMSDYVMATLYGGLIAVLAVSVTATAGNLHVALLAFAIGQAVPLLAVAAIFLRIRLRNQLPPWLSENVSFSPQSFSALGGFAGVALSILLFGNVVNFYVRGLAIREFGAETAGLWQALVKLSGSYGQVFTAMISIAFFPKLSEKIADKKATVDFIKQNALLWTPIIAGGLLIVYFLRNYLISWLFSVEFVPAGALILPQLAGDFFNLSSYFLAYWLLAEARIITFIITQAISAAVYVASIYLLLPFLGILTFPTAYAIQSFVYILVLAGIFLKAVTENQSVMKEQEN
jgi:PST family polysaccharide transporter